VHTISIRYYNVHITSGSKKIKEEKNLTSK